MTADERLRKGEWAVARVPLSTCHRLERAHHYARGGSKAGIGYGLFHADAPLACVGVAHYNMCQREQGDLAWPPTAHGGGWREVWTLHRLAIAPDVPRNACTFLIARSSRLIARDAGACCLLSYADTRMGHTGAIYRGANWEYTGLVRGDKTWIDPATGRQVAQRRGNRTMTDAEMRALGYEDCGYWPKHRYRYIIPAPRRHGAATQPTLYDRYERLEAAR